MSISKAGPCPRPVALLCALAVLAAATAAAQSTYRVVDLGRLSSSGSYFSYAESLNNLNQVAGFTYLQTAYHAFLYVPTSGTMSDMGDLAGGDDLSHAVAVNDLGVAAGSSSEAVLVNASWTTLTRAFKWSARAGLDDIGADVNPDGHSFAYDINSSAWVVGRHSAVGISTYSNRAFLWKPGGVVTYLPHLDPAGMPSTRANAITDAGLVVGESSGSNIGTRAFEWDEVNGISTIPGDTTLASRARDVNESGMVVGQAVVSDGQGGTEYAGIVLEGGQLTTIDLPAGAVIIDAVAVNARGEVVGSVGIELPTLCLDTGSLPDPTCFADKMTDRAFVWAAATGRVDLTSQIDPADPLAGTLFVTSANDINDHGFIAANGYVSGQSGQHAFLLIPTLVFSDGFETGDASRWSQVVPP